MKMLCTIFVQPFVWLFSWIKAKWAWRGWATVTKKDWQKTGDKAAIPRSHPLGVDAPFGRLMKDLRKDQSMIEAQTALTKVLWPEAHPPYLYDVKEEGMSVEEIEKTTKDMLEKANISYQDFNMCMGPEGNLEGSCKIKGSDDGDNS